MTERRSAEGAEAKKGSVMEAIGKITADPKMEAEGAAQQAGLQPETDGQTAEHSADQNDD